MTSKIDTSDPNVRRAVYNMYRGILGNYNDKANSIVNTLPKYKVRQDQGIDKQLESMIKQSKQMSGGGATSPSPGPPPGVPPPPPPYAAGAIPSVRIPSEISNRKEPPAAIQNAMMTKDKKPFTYTPGGLDLAEIRSPRMAKRISRNAHIEDSCTGAATAPTSAAPPIQPHQLPPQALAAMQPQIAVAVLPPGATLPRPHGSPTTPGAGGSPNSPNIAVAQSPPLMPSGGVLTPSLIPNSSAPPPPPLQNSGGPPLSPIQNEVAPPPPPLPTSAPPPPSMLNHNAPPPPPMPAAGGPPPPPPLPGNGALPKPISSDVSPGSGLSSPSDTLRRNQPRPDYIADIANHVHTLKRVNHPPRSQAELPSQAFPQIQLRQTGLHPKMQGNDEERPDGFETDEPEPMRQKSPSPPKPAPNGVAMAPIEIRNNVSPSLVQQPTRPNFQHPIQQGSLPSTQTYSPSPQIGYQPRMYNPQMSPATPTIPEVSKTRFSPPRTSPPREDIKTFQPQVFATTQATPIPPPPMNNQPRMFRPQMSPVTPPVQESPSNNFNQYRVSPPREIVTVFQPQVFQDSGIPHQTERNQGKSRPPGLKMPDVREQAPRNTPPSSAGLRQAPAPWMSSQRNSITKELPPWASREEATPPARTPQPFTPQMNTRIVPMNMEGYQQEQQNQQQPQSSAASSRQANVRIIPIRLEGTNDVIQPQSSQSNNCRYDQANNGVPQYQQPAPVIQQAMLNQQMPQSPRGWNQVQAPVQSRSFRVLQKITDLNQEDEPYREMMSPPVYTMPPTYSPHFFNMRSPTYDNHGHPGESEY